MHEYVLKLTSTTLPRSALSLNGAELSQLTAPSRSGMRLSSIFPDAIATAPQMRAAAPIPKVRLFIRNSVLFPPRTTSADASSVSVFCENVVSRLHHCVARGPALRIVGLRRFVTRVTGPEGTGG